MLIKYTEVNYRWKSHCKWREERWKYPILYWSPYMWSDTTCCHTHCDDRDSCHNPRTTSNKPEKSTEYNTDQMHNKNLKLIKNGNKI